MKPDYSPHDRVVEHDGAFWCLDCKAKWGALPGNPSMPAACMKPTQQSLNLTRDWLEATALVEQLQQALRELAQWGTPEGDCWCDNPLAPLTHSPGCRAARAALSGHANAQTATKQE